MIKIPFSISKEVDTIFIKIVKIFLLVLIIFVIFCLLYYLYFFGNDFLSDDTVYNATQRNIDDRPGNTVVRVIDGDTFDLKNGIRVRLICVDTPEKGAPDYLESKEYLETLVMDKVVRLVSDIDPFDIYNRSLFYVYVFDEDGKEIFVNKELVKSGHAKIFAYGNNTGKCKEIQA